jgi:hypothetical protein
MPSPSRRAPHSPDGAMQVWQSRTDMVKKEMQAESAANDAKTARLKAQRLEKEALDAEAARVASENAPPAPKKRTKRSV